MKAVCWYGTEDVRVEKVPDPKIEDARDAIVCVTSTADAEKLAKLYGYPGGGLFGYSHLYGRLGG